MVCTLTARSLVHASYTVDIVYRSSWQIVHGIFGGAGDKPFDQDKAGQGKDGDNQIWQDRDIRWECLKLAFSASGKFELLCGQPMCKLGQPTK
eukprot:4635493-Pyramimonas_sp.AAC.1